MTRVQTTKKGPYLTKSEFLKISKEKGLKGNYGNYRQYVDTQRSRREAQRIAAQAQGTGQGFYQTPPSLIESQANRYFPIDPFLGATAPNALMRQASSLANPLFASAIKNITDQINARSKAGTQAIEGYTNQLAGNLGQYAGVTQSIYDQAKGEQGRIDDALRTFMQSQGSALADQVRQQAIAAGQSTAGANQMAATGAGAAAASAASGSAAASLLAAQGASAQDFASSLPGVARLEGAQQLGAFQGDLNRMLAEGVGDLKAQVPQTVSALYQNLLDREMQKAGLRQSVIQQRANYIGQGLDRNADMQLAGATLGLNAQELALRGQQMNLDEAYRQSQLALQRDQFLWQKSQEVGKDGKTWADKFGALYEQGIGLAGELGSDQYERMKSGIQGKLLRKALPYGKVRARLVSFARSALGPDAPQKLVNFYVNQWLSAAGLVKPSPQSAVSNVDLSQIAGSDFWNQSFPAVPPDMNPGVSAFGPIEVNSKGAWIRAINPSPLYPWGTQR